MPSRERKEEYFKKLTGLLDSHTKAFLVHADHVGSKQFSNIRVGLRGVGTVAMGKNTMMRKCITIYCEANPDSPWKSFIPLLRGNVGIIFVKDDFGACKQVIMDNTVPAPAKAGVLANRDVWCPAGPTGCDPSMTSYFQVLNVPTKISKGQIEITGEVQMVTKGERVTAGAASLLQKLNIKPFTYGLVIKQVFDSGSIFASEVLDLSEGDICASFLSGARNIAAISLMIGYPTACSVPHSLNGALKKLIAVVAALSEKDGKFKFELAEPVLAYLADPSAFAVSTSTDEKKEEKKEEEEEEEEEEVAAMDFGGGDDDDW